MEKIFFAFPKGFVEWKNLFQFSYRKISVTRRMPE